MCLMYIQFLVQYIEYIMCVVCLTENNHPEHCNPQGLDNKTISPSADLAAFSYEF